jgi:hypothetical protein
MTNGYKINFYDDDNQQQQQNEPMLNDSIEFQITKHGTLCKPVQDHTGIDNGNTLVFSYKVRDMKHVIIGGRLFTVQSNSGFTLHDFNSRLFEEDQDDCIRKGYEIDHTVTGIIRQPFITDKLPRQQVPSITMSNYDLTKNVVFTLVHVTEL